MCAKWINETPDLYKNVTLPYITTYSLSIKWIYKILEHKQEDELIMYKDSDPENGFILLPDYKWWSFDVADLHILAIPHKRGIKSLRDLNASHLPLLRNIRSGAIATIEEWYGLSSTEIRMYFHYQPSSYHLHLHVKPLHGDAPICEEYRTLDRVINNIEILPDYYQKATLPFKLHSGNKTSLPSLLQYKAGLPLQKSTKRSRNSTGDNECNPPQNKKRRY